MEKYRETGHAAADCVLPQVPDNESAPRDRSASGKNQAEDPAAMYDTRPCDVQGTLVIPDDRPRRDGPGGN